MTANFTMPTRVTACPTCKSSGFQESILGKDRCTFCDGTEGGQGPTLEDVAPLLIEARAELDRLSAQGGEVPRLDAPTLLAMYDIQGDTWGDFADRINEWFRANSRPAPPHPDTVEVSREEWELLKHLRGAVNGWRYHERNTIYILNALVDIEFYEHRRAQVQPATEREGA